MGVMWRKEVVIKKLKEAQGNQTQAEFAATLGCSASYLNQVYSGKRAPSDKLLDHLDLECVITYVPKRRWR